MSMARSSTDSSATSQTMVSQQLMVSTRPVTQSRNGHRDLASLESFQNALLVHQKRLKVNSTKIFRTANAIGPLIENYHAMISTHLKVGRLTTGPSNAGLRRMARAAISRAIEQYDQLIEERRCTLEEHGALLELASEITYLRLTNKMLEAINLQIAAAEDLDQRMEARRLEAGWKAFKQTPAG